MIIYSRKIRMTFHDVIDKVTQNLRSQGFGIITSIDVQDSFIKTFDIRFRKYQILSACHPRFAYKAISLESHLGVLLPCNVVVQEHEDGEVEVSAVNPLENIDKSLNTPQLEDLAVEMGIRLRAAIDFIQREISDTHHETLSTRKNTEASKTQ
jgi:uncharacterized protein (DUF302 family)